MKIQWKMVRKRTSTVRLNVLWLAGAVVSMLVTTGCQTNPYTGRWQLMMMPMSQETQMGAQAYAEVKQDPNMRPSTDPREIEPVKRVAARVIEAAKRSKYSEMANQFEWEVTVIKDDKTMNAFALPGGKIAVYTGIFPVAKTEAGLAAVMGHEVVHALARHGGERMSQNTLAQTTLQAIGIALGVSGANPVVSQGAMAALGVGAQVGVLLPFSRKHESEADYVGVLLAADAGYDPRESIQLWTRMGELSGGKSSSEFMSTHPSHETRIEQLEEWMAEAMPIYESKPPAPNSALPQLH
ncbi:MAG: M48 family metallopeptidase [Nitrospira sp.]|jgi:predicted Zn-dependent protease|nr:M48 family metallopeptidase [Nitrospira sp.]HQY56698.1 M48 family metallopeptidase [Nitrospira sp.]HRA95734.1 M48 family metallopeptidase [Nitrospira sp.]